MYICFCCMINNFNNHLYYLCSDNNNSILIIIINIIYIFFQCIIIIALTVLVCCYCQYYITALNYLLYFVFLKSVLKVRWKNERQSARKTAMNKLLQAKSQNDKDKMKAAINELKT